MLVIMVTKKLSNNDRLIKLLIINTFLQINFYFIRQEE